MKPSSFVSSLRLPGSLLLSVCVTCIAFAQASVPPDASAKALLDAKAEAMLEAKAEAVSTSLADKLDDLGFAAGLGAVFMSGSPEVENASVDSGGILRADFKSKTRLGTLVEAHYLFTDLVGDSSVDLKAAKQAVATKTPKNIRDFSPGIMVGAELGDDGLRSLGLGIIGSWRRFKVETDGTLTQKVAFNLGVMGLVEQNVKMLADGFSDGSPLPAGQTAIRFKERTRNGFAVVFSVGY